MIQYGPGTRNLRRPTAEAHYNGPSLCFTQCDGVEVWRVVRRGLPVSGDVSPQPAGCGRLLGGCPVEALGDKRPHAARCGHGAQATTPVGRPSWFSTVLVCGVGGHAFTAPLGTAVDSDACVALHLTVEPLTTVPGTSVAAPGTSIAVPGTTRKVAIPGTILGGFSCGGG